MKKILNNLHEICILVKYFMISQGLYDRYHSNRQLQKKVINSNNFTYKTTIGIIERYSKDSLTILDVGSGVGTIDFYLASKGLKVVGIDISSKAINQSINNALYFGLDKNIKYVCATFPNIKLGKKFDIVIVSEVLEHLYNDKLAVKKIYQLLRKGGIVIASSPSSNAPLFRWGMLKDFDKQVGHVRRYTPKAYAKLFTSLGFKVIEIIKTEGVVRNLLFTNKTASKFLRYIKGPISNLVTFVDNLTIKWFGESQIFIVGKK